MTRRNFPERAKPALRVLKSSGLLAVEYPRECNGGGMHAFLKVLRKRSCDRKSPPLLSRHYGSRFAFQNALAKSIGDGSTIVAMKRIFCQLRMICFPCLNQKLFSLTTAIGMALFLDASSNAWPGLFSILKFRWNLSLPVLGQRSNDFPAALGSATWPLNGKWTGKTG